MFQKVIFIICMLFPFSAFAADDWSFGSIFSVMDSFFEVVLDVIYVEIPSFFDRLIAYLVEFIVLMKVTLFIYSVETAFNVANLILADVGFIQLVEEFAGRMPSSVRNAAVDLKIFQAFNLIVEAYIARFVLSVF